MKKSVTCLLALLCLIIAFAFQPAFAMADLAFPAFSLLPEGTIAVLVSPKPDDQPGIIYALYGITKDDKTLSVSVRQISTDPQLTIYEENVVNTNEQDIRFGNFFTADQPIIGSYCDATIETNPDAESARDRWAYPQREEIIPHGHYMDETFFFPVADLGDTGEKLTLSLSYNCIPVPGTLAELPLCLFTIDLTEYVNLAASPSLAALDAALLPDDTIVLLSSPPSHENRAIIYALYGVTGDTASLSFSMRQISTDTGLKIYKEWLSNVTELHIRQTNDFTFDEPIIGSYCEAYIEQNPDGETFTDRWRFPPHSSGNSQGYYMDDEYDFSLSEPYPLIDDDIILLLEYYCVPVPGTLNVLPCCCFTLDLADYLK